MSYRAKAITKKVSRTLFLGDSHTVGYQTIPNKIGVGSYSFWNDNSYCEEYSLLHDKPVVIYGMAGTPNRMYTDWMSSMFNTYSDIDEVFLCLSPLNRMVLGFEGTLTDGALPLNYFTHECDESSTRVKKYMDVLSKKEAVQFFTKPVNEDYTKFPGIDVSSERGIVSPDVRSHTYMQTQLFFHCNTHLEKRDLLLNVYAWDRMCADRHVKLYIFNFMERLKWPPNWNYYGKLHNTVIASKTVEGFMKESNIDHTQYFLPDKEHYNKEFHNMIAKDYLTWLKESY